MGFLFGIPKRLIQRIKEIEIDTHYYDKDVVPSAQSIFTYTVNKKKEIATITGLVNPSATVTAVIPYQIHYDQTSQELIAKVTELSENCFSNNSTLKTITIPNTIHVIPSNCFKNCSALHTVNIPTSVHTIKANAFNNCDSLHSVFIPHGVSTIEAGAFLECENLKIICYKHSKAEEYAKTNNIPYSLISYTLDDDITENSENLVTSGVIWKHVQNIVTTITNHVNDVFNPHKVTKTQVGLSNVDNTSDENKPLSKAAIAEFKATNETINNHIDNKNNPHDNSTFNNPTLTGTTNISTGTLTSVNSSNGNSLVNVSYLKQAVGNITEPSEGVGYQTIIDNNLETNANTVVGAINEINNKINFIQTDLTAGWNTVSVNKKYPIDWEFFSKPYCYTIDGLSVDYRIRNYDNNIIDNMHAFEIYVPVDCKMNCSTIISNVIDGYPIDYVLISYYYTGNDGDDLDTITAINNSNWPLSSRYVGYTTEHNHESVVDSSNNVLIQWGGDNTGGGSNHGTTKFYESIYLDIKNIQNQLPNEDIEITLYGTWYDTMGDGNIHISLNTYACDSKPKVTIDSSTKMISLSSSDNTFINSYSNEDMFTCKVVTKKGTPTDYANVYTPIFKIVLHRSYGESNYRTISVQPLS